MSADQPQADASPVVGAPAPLFELRELSREYPTPQGPFAAVDRASTEIHSGETLAVVGRSGSGKTTLLNLLAGLDHATSGELLFQGQALHTFNEDERTAWRAQHVGVVFQFFQLLPTLTVQENVLLPLELAGSQLPWPKRVDLAHDLLERVGVGDQAGKFPAALSGGQQQRVAIARALVNAPAVLVADEPTGNLDSQTASQVIDLFSSLATEGTTLILATHEPEMAARAHRTLHIEDGRVSVETSLEEIGSGSAAR